MKIITFNGGLGNQMFEYAYFYYLKKKFPTQKFYSYMPASGLMAHNGLEISKWFNVNLPASSALTDFLGWSITFLDKVFRHLHLNIHVMSRDAYLNDSKILHTGWYQNKKYMADGIPFQFKSYHLSEENKSYLEKIQSCNSVAVHVRRNDYLIPAIRPMYEGLCTERYYQSAIDRIKETVENPVFFFFSDDIDYIQSHFDVPNKVIVSCNKKENSFFDLYLMAHCQNMILANSTFSCWAAYLNQNVKQVLCPIRWSNVTPSPDLILDDWQIIQP